MHEGNIIISGEHGTGKSRSVAARVTRLIKENVCRPREILLLCHDRRDVEGLERELEAQGLSLETLSAMPVRTVREFARDELDPGRCGTYA